MCGADDPDCRKPMVWDEFEYEDETHHPFGKNKIVNKVNVDKDLFKYYQSLINLRKENACLRRGDYKTILSDDSQQLFCFERELDNEAIRVIFNLSNEPKNIEKSVFLSSDLQKWQQIFCSTETENILPSKVAIVYKKVK